MEKVKYLKELEAQGLPAITQDPKKKQTNIYFDTEMPEIGENQQEDDEFSEFNKADIPRLAWASSTPKFTGVRFRKMLPPN